MALRLVRSLVAFEPGLEAAFWASPSVRRMLCAVDRAAVFMALFNNALLLIGFKQLGSQAALRRQMVNAAVNISCQLAGIALLSWRPLYYYRHRNKVMTLHRLLRIIQFYQASSVLKEVTTVPLGALDFFFAGSPWHERYVLLKILWMGTGVPLVWVHTFLFPVPILLQAALQLGNLPALILLSHHVVAIANQPRYRPAVCDAFHASQRLLSPTWRLAAVLDGSSGGGLACPAIAPRYLVYLTIVVLGAVWPVYIAQAVELHHRCVFLAQHYGGSMHGGRGYAAKVFTGLAIASLVSVYAVNAYFQLLSFDDDV